MSRRNRCLQRFQVKWRENFIERVMVHKSGRTCQEQNIEQRSNWLETHIFDVFNEAKQARTRRTKGRITGEKCNYRREVQVQSVTDFCPNGGSLEGSDGRRIGINSTSSEFFWMGDSGDPSLVLQVNFLWRVWSIIVAQILTSALEKRLTEVENTTLGIVAGAIEAIATQPLTYAKNARQQGMPLTLNPRQLTWPYHSWLNDLCHCRLLYRGVTISAANDGVMVGCQFVLTGYTQKLVTGGQAR